MRTLLVFCGVEGSERVGKTVETERITNLAELEQLVRDARMDIIHLKQVMEKDNKEASMHLLEQLDLKLHSMEAFDFVLERRTITLQ